MTKPFALIIEDDPKLTFVFRTALQEAGFETAIDSNGNCYTDYLNRDGLTLILLDMHMPYASGPSILANLRANPQSVNTPILIVTADLHLANSMQAIGEQVLLKPITVGRLIEVASQYLPQRDADN